MGEVTREDLEAMHAEVDAGERSEGGGLPYNLDDSLKQARISRRVGLSPERWAEARAVPVEYARMLWRYLDQG
ncbi:MAG: hypothetical protein M3N18_11175 [Actinomycetota bacterium]|nr:hypothetical protein [Actinomycetota bacterium]